MFLYFVSYIIYASSLESKVWLDAVTIFQINNMQRGGFLCDNEIILIHQTTNFYATLAPKTFLRILTIDSMHLIVITCHDLNFNFIFFFKNIQSGSWIVRKNVRSLMVKIILKLEALSRNYRRKIEENIMEDACIHVSACVSACQPVSTVVMWNR